MNLTADVFPILRTPKNMVRSMPRKSRFRGSDKKQHGECAQTLFRFERHLLYHIYQSLGSQLSDKKSLLVICNITKLLPNTVSGEDKYSVLDRDNLTQGIQMLLSRKQKTFSPFFSSFLKSSSNLKHFQKKDHPLS